MEYSDNQVAKAVLVSEGIRKTVLRQGWREGMRNDMAVDLCCALHVQGIGFTEMTKWVDENMEFDDMLDKRDCIFRMAKVNGYLDRWDTSLNGVFDKMLLTDNWISAAHD